ncbi:MAG: hypothetical protein Q7R48_04205, partial [bacterium]|nr:hypothetical protein [bacterium]
YSFWKKSAPQETQVQTPEPTPPSAEEAKQQEESSLPFPVDKIVPVSSSEDISKLLSEELTQGITGVSFEGVQTPLTMLGIELSEQVKPLVRPSFLLFLHTLGEKKRFGLAFTVNGTEKIMKEELLLWEPDMEKDTASLFRLMGTPGTGHVSFFRSTQHDGVAIRFQTLSLNDFGIVYALSHNLLLITSSLESMNVLLDTLEKPAL